MGFVFKHQLMNYSGKISRVISSRLFNTSSAVNLAKLPVVNSNSGRISFQQFNRKLHSSFTPRSPDKGDKVTIHIKTEDDNVTLTGEVGDSILDVIVNNDYDIIGYGACEGTIACSTCHCILTADDYSAHTAGKTEEEKDLLDMIAHIKKKTSRLGCQVYLTKASEGMEVFIPPPVDVRED